MSDLYDSLEDECDENKCSSDSMNECEASSGVFVTANSNNSFFLSKNVSEERISILPNFQSAKTPLNNSEKKNFLPEIGNGINENGPESVRSLVVDKHILTKQGLQLNEDGSITKSPRLDTEELPFITREYRNLQFQRKNVYKTNKKPSLKKNQKNMFSFTKKPEDGISMNQIINARKEKGSSEEMLTSRGSSFSVITQTEKQKQFVPNDNLTDSMKEKLLQKQRENPYITLNKTNSLKKTKRELNLAENNEISRRYKFSQRKKVNTDADQAKNVFTTEHCQKNSDLPRSNKKKQKSIDSKIIKYQSDILINTVIPKLNYSERRLLKNGYNPIYLRHWSKKFQSDTVRSNFGDSVVEELPEVSNLALSSDNLNRDDDEETFYRRLIEMDRNQKLNQLSTRSYNPLTTEKLKGLNGSSSYKDQREIRRTEEDNFRRRKTSKSMSIDLPPELDDSANTLQKFSHHCAADSSRNLSKTELALKAKAYGYLANARNIFKLKAQSERRSVGNEKDGNSNMSLKKKILNFSLDSGRLSKLNSSPVNSFPKVKGGSPQSFGKFPKATKSLCRAKCFLRIAKGSEEKFALPPVHVPEVRSSHIQKEILQQVSSCLKALDG